VCFIDYSSTVQAVSEGRKIYEESKQNFYGDENLFFYPYNSAGELSSVIIKNIDLEKITQDKNPFCIENKNGKVNLRIKKNYRENLVTITED